jgi:DNA-binding GntR family transcriptional regulator
MLYCACNTHYLLCDARADHSKPEDNVVTDPLGASADKRRGHTLPAKSTALGPSAKPARRDGKRKPRDMTWTVYSSLRESILNGALPPGESLSQVQLASQLGVSRGPLREAVRMLQREGLVEAEVNRRGRVSSFSIDDLEQLYAMRIVHDSLAIRINVPRFTKRDIDALRGCLRRMEAVAGHDLRQWQAIDREFHFTLLAHSGDRLLRTIRELYDHADRYRWLYIKGVPRALSIAADEHKAIFDACVNGDSALAAAQLARHLARTALTVLTHHAPEHDPTTVRAAIRLATGAEVAPSNVQPLSVRARGAIKTSPS